MNVQERLIFAPYGNETFFKNFYVSFYFILNPLTSSYLL